MAKQTQPFRTPGYRRRKSRTSKLDPFLPVIQQILKQDKSSHRKQRQTAKKIFERLQNEHGDSDGQTRVAMAVRDLKQKSREVFLPLSHPPGEAQIDIGFADVHLSGQLTKVALLVMTLPYSDAIFLQAFPRECTESFLEGHVRAFDFFGGVPTRISDDNSKAEVCRRPSQAGPNDASQVATCHTLNEWRSLPLSHRDQIGGLYLIEHIQ